MKKIIINILCLLLCVFLFACSSKDKLITVSYSKGDINAVGSIESFSYKIRTIIVIEENKYENSNREFLGWSFNDVLYYPGDTIVADANILFEAKWGDVIETYSIFYLKGEENATGTAPTINYKAGDRVTLIDCPFLNTNKKFNGWFYNNKLYNSGDTISMPAKNIELRATWQYINTNQETNNFVLGIENIDKYQSLFNGKRVGLITNPTGITSGYQSSIDFLYKKTNLVSLFAPEHGIRGNAQAGGVIGNEIDIVTNLPVNSLYGSTKKPTKEMLDGIDILCIDIQDVGARFYTYIYTMAYAMEACKEFNKKFVVFDRPNPISGDIVDGNILNPVYKSFVGMYPIITRHGMTIGEIANLFNNEYNIGCDLTIIKMENYDRTLFYDELSIPWVNPSPNIPTLETAIVYTGTGHFEGLNISEGRGTTKPFEFIGAPFINPYLWSDRLNSLNLPGVYFRPIYFTPNNEDFANQQCGGVQVHVTNRKTFSSVKTGFAMIYTVKELFGNDVVFQSYLRTISGVDYVFNQTYSLNGLFTVIDNDVNKFKMIREKYLLY